MLDFYLCPGLAHFDLARLGIVDTRQLEGSDATPLPDQSPGPATKRDCTPKAIQELVSLGLHSFQPSPDRICPLDEHDVLALFFDDLQEDLLAAGVLADVGLVRSRDHPDDDQQVEFLQRLLGVCLPPISQCIIEGGQIDVQFSGSLELECYPDVDPPGDSLG